jgi:hypothetical protein
LSVVPYAAPAHEPSSWLDIIDRASELSEVIANTEFVPKGLRGNQPAILAAMLYGNEVGLGPMQSLSKIAVIDGKPSLAAEAMRALVRRAGHEIWIEESTTTRAIVAGRRRGEKVTQRVTWTLDDAKRAGIGGRQNWQRYPRQMLLARAWAELCRHVFDDAIGGLAATEEVEEAVDDGPTVEAVEEDKPKTTRRRRRLTPAPEPEPEPTPEPAEPDTLSGPQLQKLQVLFRERGIIDRDERLAMSRALIGRDITTSSELTSGEASQIIDHLDALPPVVENPTGFGETPIVGPPISLHNRGELLGLLAERGIEGSEAVGYLQGISGGSLDIKSVGELSNDAAEHIIGLLRSHIEPAASSELPPLPPNEQAALDELERHAEPQDL